MRPGSYPTPTTLPAFAVLGAMLCLCAIGGLASIHAHELSAHKALLAAARQERAEFRRAMRERGREFSSAIHSALERGVERERYLAVSTDVGTLFLSATEPPRSQ